MSEVASDTISLISQNNLTSNGATATAISVGTWSGITHYASRAVDGDIITGWRSNWHNPAWITVDLQSVNTISKLKLHWQQTSHSYSVEASTDNSNWQTIVSTRNGTKSTIDELSIGSVNARYIKISMLTTDAPGHWIFQSQLQEIEIF